MFILAIDTSGRQGSVALCTAAADRFHVPGMTELEGGTYSARLIPTIDSLLKEQCRAAADLDGFAVVSGPGSFTGLRVGLATVKGLCEVLGKPLVTVSMLEAVAATCGAPSTNVTAVLDAGRGEMYVGEYKLHPSAAIAIREYIVKLGDYAASGGEVITPDAPVAERLAASGVAVRLVAPVKADGIGRIAIRKLLAGEVADRATVDVNYIRRSDAEIFSAPKG